LHEALKAADALAEEGVSARVIDLYSLKPVDVETLRAAAEATGGRFVTAEDHWPEGGLGEAVLAAFADAEDRPRVIQLAVREMPASGAPAELLAAAGIDAEHIAAAARRLAGAADLTAAGRELRRLEEAMASGDHEAATLRRYAETQARLEHAGGYAWRERLDSVTRNLGFSSADLERPLATFSGGELTRASLARALGGDPDLLLLDEPTNHLDVASLEWLERELQSIDTAVIL